MSPFQQLRLTALFLWGHYRLLGSQLWKTQVTVITPGLLGPTWPVLIKAQFSGNTHKEERSLLTLSEP